MLAPQRATIAAAKRLAAMHNIWFISNIGSGTTTSAKGEALRALFAEHGVNIVGETDFPEQAIPDAATLDEARADTVVLFAGDGTINAAACKLAEWQGALLILPGGTMNLLAKALHGNADPAEIVKAAHAGGERIAMPFVEAGPHRAFVGLILGPAGNWARAREAVRAGQLRALLRALALAWRRTFGRGVRVTGAAGLPRESQALFIQADRQRLKVAAIDARDWRSIATLGWEWLTGDWVAASAVREVRARTLRIAERRPVLALFDGEPVMLDGDQMIGAGLTERQFIRTV